MKCFREKFQHQLEQLIQESLETNLRKDVPEEAIEKVNIVANVLITSGSSVLNALGICHRAVTIPNKNVAILQVATTENYLKATQAADEQTKELEACEQQLH